MEDKDDLENLPLDLRQELINHRIYRTLGLKALMELQSRNFWNDIEEEMWKLLSLPGHVQSGLFTVMFGTSALQQLRKQARINILEANAYRVAEYKEWTRQQEADIWRRYYAGAVSQL